MTEERSESVCVGVGRQRWYGDENVNADRDVEREGEASE